MKILLSLQESNALNGFLCFFERVQITRNTTIRFWIYSLIMKEFAMRNSELMILNRCNRRQFDSSSIAHYTPISRGIQRYSGVSLLQIAV
jgi:hypothetical protein